jgi:hypothetical protein
MRADPRWLKGGGELETESSFIAGYLSLSEEDKASVRTVVEKVWRASYEK